MLEGISPSLVNAFYEECEELLDNTEEALLKIEQEGSKANLIDEVFRNMHTIKGSSASLGLTSMSTMAHNFEDILGDIKEKGLGLNERIINRLLESLDIFKNIISYLKQGKNYEFDIDRYKLMHDEINLKADVSNSVFGVTPGDIKDIYSQLNANETPYYIKITLYKDSSLKGARLYIITRKLEEIGSIYKKSWNDNSKVSDDGGELFHIIFASQHTQREIKLLVEGIPDVKSVNIDKIEPGDDSEKINISEKHETVQTVIRVDTRKLDNLLKIVGELSIDKERLKQITDNIKHKYKKDEDVRVLTSLVQHIDFIGTQMQESVMSTRMYTLENLFQRFPRMVRDLSVKEGKEINFVMEGENTELDRTIIEKIVDPLTHIIRNAVDHGIEKPEDRLQNNKDRKGTIKLSAGQEENHIVIRVENDGRPIDIQKIKSVAIKKEIYTPEELENMTEYEIIQTIFMPNFSTADRVTDISGRGVGMNVVKENIEKINGIIEVENKPEKGVAITMKLPLTLAIIQALLIKSGSFRFGIPLASILEIIRIKRDEYHERIKTVQGREVIRWRDEIISFMGINEFFNSKASYDRDKVIGVVIGFSNRKIVIGVEDIIGQQQVVIKSMGDYTGKDNILGDLRGIVGTATLGDGNFAYILDVQSLIKDK